VNVLLRLLELESIANLTPANLAPVWRKRAALARALALKPELLLLDNPNGGLTARHRHWLVNFLDQLWLGHEYLEGRRLTIAITTDDLRAWENPRRRFAAVHEGKFSVLGCWGETEFMRHQAILELLALPAPSERSQTNEDGGRNRV
jgi:ABC-type sulfate/molybdate transport systems ATPase subunit